MKTPTGLSEETLTAIVSAIAQFREIESAVLYGSRAKGNYRGGSDVDLAIKGGQVSDATIKRLSDILNEELPLPYFFDVIHFEAITSTDLVAHINRVGNVIYSA